MKKYILLVIALVSLLSSCRRAPYINILDTVSVSSPGGRQTLAIDANYGWSAKSDVSWMTVSTPTSEKDPSRIVIEVAPNYSTDSRTARLTIVCEELSKVVQVVQDQLDKLEIVSGEKTVDYKARTFSYSVSANIDYKVEIPASVTWLTCTKSKAMTTSSFDFTVLENTSLKDRTANLKFINSEKGYEQAFSITQTGAPQTIKLTFSGSTFVIPQISGSDMIPGNVDWGDGSKELYAFPMTHKYAGQGPYNVTIENARATSVKIEATRGISYLDISGFDSL